MTQALVLSHLEYCSVVWSSAAKREIKKLQLAQNRAARLVLNCSFKTNVAKMHHSLEWLTVDAKLTASLIKFSRNAIIDGKPDFYRDQLFSSGEKHRYQTRQVSTGYLSLPKPNTEILKKICYLQSHPTVELIIC